MVFSADDDERAERAVTRAREQLATDVAKTRIKRGLTQIDIASALGVSLGTVAAIEQGRADPRLSMIARLSAVLGVALLGVEAKR